MRNQENPNLPPKTFIYNLSKSFCSSSSSLERGNNNLKKTISKSEANVMFKDKVITIFGGTGSIGTLITEKFLSLNDKPRQILLFSNNENELWESKNHFASVPFGCDYIRFIFGDIRDKSAVKKAARKADIVFNCAALKHVSICESDPIAAVETNILGLKNILAACDVEGEPTLFIQVSTDKAVEPVSVMGATKLIGERLCRQRIDCRVAVIRLGNVVGSRGSLVPQVKEYLKRGKLIFISDPNMKRFFLTKEQVAQFILKVCEHAKGSRAQGNIYIPKMEEIPIMDIVSKTCSQLGIEDPEYCYYGHDESEKLSEALIAQSELNIVHELEDMYILGDQKGAVL